MLHVHIEDQWIARYDALHFPFFQIDEFVTWIAIFLDAV